MQTLLYYIITFINNIHNSILGWNDQIENSFTDKELHFIVIGIFGIALILILHPIFLWLARTGHTMIVSFLYVFTVILVVTFAIEIGQHVTNTGTLEFADIAFGVVGFLAMFAVFAVIRGIVLLLLRPLRRRRRR